MIGFPWRLRLNQARETMSLSQLFWIVFGVEAVASVGFAIAAFSSKGWGPEGPVGAWLLLIPGVFLIVLGAVALLTRSQAVMTTGLALMLIPAASMIVGPILSK